MSALHFIGQEKENQGRMRTEAEFADLLSSTISLHYIDINLSSNMGDVFTAATPFSQKLCLKSTLPIAADVHGNLIESFNRIVCCNRST